MAEGLVGLKYRDGNRVVSKCVVAYTFVGSLLQKEGKKKNTPLETLSSSSNSDGSNDHFPFTPSLLLKRDRS